MSLPEQGDTERYEADVFCANCGYDGPVQAVVGDRVHTEPCPVCQTLSLRPKAHLEWEWMHKTHDQT